MILVERMTHCISLPIALSAPVAVNGNCNNTVKTQPRVAVVHNGFGRLFGGIGITLEILRTDYPVTSVRNLIYWASGPASVARGQHLLTSVVLKRNLIKIKSVQ